MRCGPTEPGRCAAEGCAPPARGPAPARHSPGERRSAAEDAVPRLVNRACLRSNQTRQINNWEETEIPRHHCPDPLLLHAPRHYHSPVGSAQGSPQGDRAKGVTAALRQARATPLPAPPGCHRGSRTRESFSDSRPSKERSVPCAQPPQPLTLATRRGGWEAQEQRACSRCVQTRRLQVLPREAVITRYTPCDCLPAPRGWGHPPRTAEALLRPSAPFLSGATASRQSHGVQSGGTSPGRSHRGRR